MSNQELKNKFKKSFNNLEVPETLDKLIEFSKTESPKEFFSNGFEFRLDEDKYGWKTYSEEPEFYNNLHEFANADGSGSSYAFWINNNQTNLEETPIVVSGSEGGIHIVAENIKELLIILAADCFAFICWEEVHYSKDKDYITTNHKKYVNWLNKEFKDINIVNPNKIVEKAQNKYQN